LEKKRIRELMGMCRGNTELVMTGRAAPQEFIEMADYVTELKQIKHPYYRGFKARMGIEY
jgi:cob(I)alamin adenosyltransferase